MFFVTNLTAQNTSIISFDGNDTTLVSRVVQNEIDSIIKNGNYEFSGFFNIADLATVQAKGKLLLEFNYDSLKHTEFVFSAKDVKYDSNEYYWYGEFFNPDTLDTVPPSFIHISKFEGEFYVFTIKLEGYAFKGITLSNGELGVFKFSGFNVICEVCHTDTLPTDTSTAGPSYSNMKTCDDNCPVDVLFLYTSQAKLKSPNIENEIYAEFQQTQTVLKNSGVDECHVRFEIVGIVPDFGFPNSQYVINDPYGGPKTLANLYSDYNAKQLKSQYKADIVILIDADQIINLIKRKDGYFGSEAFVEESMYAILGVSSLTSGRYSLAHQLGHLFSAFHHKDIYHTTGYYYGHVVKHRDYTVMWSKMDPSFPNFIYKEQRLPYFSNKFLSKAYFWNSSVPLGTSSASAAFAFMNEGCKVANLVEGFPKPFIVYITGDKEACPCMHTFLDVVVSGANVGQNTISYEWFTSSDGINYTYAGNSPNTSFSAPCVQGQVLFVKVRATSGNNMGESVATITAVNGIGGLPCALKKDPNDVASFEPPVAYSIYPNPVNEEQVINISGPFENSNVLKVYDAKGNLMVTQRISSSTNRVGLVVNGLSAGTYFVELINQNEERIILSFIKTK